MQSSPAPMPPVDRISLKQRIITAGSWTLAGYILSQIIRFGSNLVMTRLLVPEMFGVMAIATLVMVGLAMFSDFGLKQSIVQSKRANDPAFLNTAWAVQIFRGIMLWSFALGIGLLFSFAHRIGMVPKDSVYADQNLPCVIAILSLTAILAGFNSTKLFEASRNVALGRVTLIEIAAQIVGLVCMIGWVQIDRSIWSLVAGNVSSTLITAILSHVWLPGVANRWQWDKSAFQEIFHYGKWIFWSSLLGFFVISGDRLLLGGLVDATVLGVYVIAFFIFSAVEQLLMKILVDVSFPSLSEVVRERPADLKHTYYRFYTAVGAFAYLCSGILMISGQALIELVYDRRYEQAGWMLEILAVALLTTPFHVLSVSLLALGLPRINSYLVAIRLISLFLLVPLGFGLFGLVGSLWAIVASYFSPLPLMIAYKFKYGLFDLSRELTILPACLGGMLLGKGFNFIVGH